MAVDGGRGVGVVAQVDRKQTAFAKVRGCLLYTSDAADDLLCVDLGGRRIIKKKKHKQEHNIHSTGNQTHISVELEEVRTLTTVL